MELSLLEFKIVCLVVLLVLALVGGFAAFLPAFRGGRWVHIGEAFAVGIFLSVAVLHLLPDSLSDWDGFFEDEMYPVPFGLTIVGYMLGYHITLFQKWYKKKYTPEKQPDPLKMNAAYTIMILFSLSGVSGILIGAGITTIGNTAVIGCITGFAAGTFLFIQSESIQNIFSEQEHGHFGMTLDEDKSKAYLLLALLIFHSIVEGIALGVQTSVGRTGLVLIAIACHKVFSSFALGVYIVKTTVKTTTKDNDAYTEKVVNNSPSEVTVEIDKDSDGSEGETSELKNRASIGSVLSVVNGFEIMLPEKDHTHVSNWQKISAVWVGIMTMAVIAVWV